MNFVCITGNLGGDPDVFYGQEGDPVSTFNIAFRGSKKNKTGWIKVVCFGHQAESAEKYLHKGAKIGVVGQLDQSKWEDDNGNTRTSYQLIAQSIDYLKTDGRGFDQTQEEEKESF